MKRRIKPEVVVFTLPLSTHTPALPAISAPAPTSPKQANNCIGIIKGSETSKKPLMSTVKAKVGKEDNCTNPSERKVRNTGVVANNLKKNRTVENNLNLFDFYGNGKHGVIAEIARETLATTKKMPRQLIVKEAIRPRRCSLPVKYQVKAHS